MLCFTLRANVLITPVKLLTLAARALIPILVASCSIQSRLHVCVHVCVHLSNRLMLEIIVLITMIMKYRKHCLKTPTRLYFYISLFGHYNLSRLLYDVLCSQHHTTLICSNGEL